MDLKDELRKLVNLQGIDDELYFLRNLRDIEKPKELEDLKTGFEKKKEIFHVFEDNLKKLQVDKKNKELDLSSKEEALQKAQAYLYQVKTNKEYQAQLTQIESIKADISRLEDQILEIMDKIEKEEKNFKEAKEKLTNEEKVFKEEEKRIKDEINDIETKIKDLEGKRKIFADEIDKNILARYEYLVNSRRGKAIAFIDDEHCSVCHIKVTAQKINEAKMYKELIFCESCARILCIKEDL